MWWGKLIGAGFGYLLGGFFGLVLGMLLGHRFDSGFRNLPGFTASNQAQIQKAFFTASFSVMGRLSKADGSVSREEIRLAENIMAQMRLDGAMRQQAMDLFAEGKQAGFPLQQVVEDFHRVCPGNTNLHYMFLEIQLQAAYADGDLNAVEDQLLLDICGWLSISAFDYQRIKRMVQAEAGFSTGDNAQTTPSVDDAYAVLGVSADASDAEVKKAYRRLLSQHHPDKLVSKGLPEEMMKLAAQKTHEIKQAYEYVKQVRS